MLCILLTVLEVIKSLPPLPPCRRLWIYWWSFSNPTADCFVVNTKLVRGFESLNLCLTLNPNSKSKPSLKHNGMYSILLSPVRGVPRGVAALSKGADINTQEADVASVMDPPWLELFCDIPQLKTISSLNWGGGGGRSCLSVWSWIDSCELN